MERTLAFTPIKHRNVGVVAPFYPLLQQDPEAARASLSSLPAGQRLVLSLKSPLTYGSEDEITRERRRIKIVLSALEEEEYDEG